MKSLEEVTSKWETVNWICGAVESKLWENIKLICSPGCLLQQTESELFSALTLLIEWQECIQPLGYPYHVFLGLLWNNWRKSRGGTGWSKFTWNRTTAVRTVAMADRCISFLMLFVLILCFAVACLVILMRRMYWFFVLFLVLSSHFDCYIPVNLPLLVGRAVLQEIFVWDQWHTLHVILGCLNLYPQNEVPGTPLIPYESVMASRKNIIMQV